MRPVAIDYRYAQDQLEALFRQARAEDVEAGGRFDTGSAALNIWTHAWNNPAMREESSLMGTFYAAWAEENHLWKAEVECIFQGFLPPSPEEGCHSVHVKPATHSR